MRGPLLAVNHRADGLGWEKAWVLFDDVSCLKGSQSKSGVKLEQSYTPIIITISPLELAKLE